MGMELRHTGHTVPDTLLLTTDSSVPDNLPPYCPPVVSLAWDAEREETGLELGIT